jgi:Fe(3+) dicitrate transport protein
VQLVGFYNDYSNLTDICTQSNRCLNAALDRQYDAGSARIYGLEAQAAHDVPVGEALTLPLSVAYTLTLTEFRKDYESEESIFGNVEGGDEMPYVPRHQAHVSAGVQGKRAGAYAALSYIAAMREEPGTDPVNDVLHTDEQVTVDTGANVRPTSFLELYANVRNLFDAEYLVSRRPFGARSNAPRWVQVGVKARF